MSARVRVGLLLALALLGLGLRLALVLAQEVEPVYRSGGDSGWYLGNGEALFLEPVSGVARFGIPYDRRTIPTPPLYLIFVGLAQRIVPDPLGALWLIGAVQSTLSLATAGLVARLALRLTQRHSAALIVFGLLALHPALIVESASISTETLYLFCVAAALWWWANQEGRPLDYAVMGGLLALATLTRAVSLLLPLMIVAHSLLLRRRDGRRLALLLLAYAALLAPWTLYNLPTGRLIIASDQFMPAVWRGAVDAEASNTPEQSDALIAEATGCTVNCGAAVFGEQAAQAISQDIPGYLLRRAQAWARALLEPHGAQSLGSEISLRALALDFLRQPSAEGLARLLSAPTFFIELALYALWYGGLLLGLRGMWRWRAAWRLALPWAGFIGYTLAIHVVLLALPRYFFPLVPFLLLFAVAGFYTQPAAQPARIGR